MAVLMTVVMALAAVSVWTPGCEDTDGAWTTVSSVKYEVNNGVMTVKGIPDSEGNVDFPAASEVTWNGAGVTELRIVGKFSTIYNYLFTEAHGFTDLAKVDMSSSSVTEIAASAFDCWKTKEVIFPASVPSMKYVTGHENPSFRLGFADENEHDLKSCDEAIGYRFVYSPACGLLLKTEKIETHSVTYVLGDGVTGSAPEKQNLMKDAEFELEQCTAEKDGYAFKGWDFNGTTYPAGTAMTMGDADITLYAAWEKEVVYTVTFLLDGGEGSFPPIPCHPGNEIAISSVEPTKDSCTFDGWYCNGVRYSAGQTVTVDSDMTFTAQWKSNGSSDASVPMPIFPIEGQETIEVLVDDDKDSGNGKDVKTILLIAVVVAIIAELAVLSISRRG